MNWKIVLRPEASTDIFNTRDYYEQQQAGLGDRFSKGFFVRFRGASIIMDGKGRWKYPMVVFNWGEGPNPLLGRLIISENRGNRLDQRR